MLEYLEERKRYLKNGEEQDYFVGYYPLWDYFLTIHLRSNYNIVPKNEHNRECLDRRIKAVINRQYSQACFKKKNSKVLIAVSISLGLLFAIACKDMTIITLIYGVITLPLCAKRFNESESAYNLAFMKKYIIDNLDVLNEALTENDIEQFDDKQKQAYSLWDNQITMGNLGIFSDSNKTLVKRIDEKKYGK